MKIQNIAAATAVAGCVALGAAAANATVSKFSVNFVELNNSGVTGSGTLIHNDVTNMLKINYTVTGLDAGVHPQHIHGRLQGGPGSPALNSVTPTLADDSDGDGFLETVEGVPAYGDVLLSLFNTPGDPSTFPVVDASGVLNYSAVFNVADPNVFTPSPATGVVYSVADLTPLDLREIVIHGKFVQAGAGGGMFEVDGTQSDGFVPLLPAAAAEIEAVPVPASVFSMLAAGGLLVAVRNRARKRA